MPVFDYTAMTVTGKKVRETVEASSLETAKASLRKTGYTVLDIREQSILSRELDIPFLGNPKPKDMAVMCRQFVSILRAGVPVSAVLGMLTQQTENKKLRAALREAQTSIEKGLPLAASMRSHPRIFNNIMVNMVAAGEESGNLEESFRQMELYYEKVKKSRSAVGRVMIYPCILLFVMIVVLIVMMTKIIPAFTKSFAEMGTQLPKLTQGVVNFSGWFVQWWWLVVIVLLGLIVFGVLLGRTDKGSRFYGWLACRLPVLGRLTVRSASAVFCRTLSLLLGSGLTLPHALELTAGSMNNILFREAVHAMRGMITQGWPLATSLREVRRFPAMVVNLVGVGEESGDLVGMLAKAADFYDEEVEAATKRLMALMEPITILIMTVFVVLIVFSIFLPMLSMTKAYDQYLQ